MATQQKPKVAMIYGNQLQAIHDSRLKLIHHLLPNGEEDGEVIEIRGAGNQPLKLEKAWSQIIEELGTISLLPDAKRVVVVYDLQDFKTAPRGSVREAKKATKGKLDPLKKLEDYLRDVHMKSDNALVFVYHEDDEKGRRVAKSNPLFQLINDLGPVRVFQEKRLDWQFEEAVLKADLDKAISLSREWLDRGGNSTFRIVTTLNGILQLLLQARLEIDARRGNQSTSNLFKGLRPSLDSIPDFKARNVRAMASSVTLDNLHSALHRLNQIQKSFFPKGTELVIRDPREQLEILLIELIHSVRQARESA
jgi:hypothetical protein